MVAVVREDFRFVVILPTPYPDVKGETVSFGQRGLSFEGSPFFRTVINVQVRRRSRVSTENINERSVLCLISQRDFDGGHGPHAGLIDRRASGE